VGPYYREKLLLYMMLCFPFFGYVAGPYEKEAAKINLFNIVCFCFLNNRDIYDDDGNRTIHV
jgi:hypothetical protein